MIVAVLHNRHDPVSRAVVAQAEFAGYPVVDWYDPISWGEWVSAGGTEAVSAFPSVVFDDGRVQVLSIGYTYDRERDEFVPPGWSLVDGVWTAPPVETSP